MKLVNLVSTHESLTQNEDPLYGGVSTPALNPGEPMESLADKDMDDLSELDLQGLEVTMEEQIFKADQVTQQIALLQESLEVIKTTGQVTEAQRRMINIQLKGLEPYMKDNQIKAMTRYTDAPYDPGTAVQLTTESLHVGLGILAVVLVALAGLLKLCASSMNPRAASMLAKSKIDGLGKAAEIYARSMEISKTNVPKSTDSFTDIQKDSLQRLAATSLRKFAGYSGKVDIDLLELNQGRFSDRMVKMHVDNLVSFVNDIADISKTIERAVRTNDQEAIKKYGDMLAEACTRFAAHFKAQGDPISSSVAREMGSESGNVRGFGMTKLAWTTAIELVGENKDDVRVYIASDAGDSAAATISCADLPSLTRFQAGGQAEKFIKDLEVSRAAMEKSSIEVVKTAKSIEASQKKSGEKYPSIAASFGKANRLIKGKATIIRNMINEANVVIPDLNIVVLKSAVKNKEG